MNRTVVDNILAYSKAKTNLTSSFCTATGSTGTAAKDNADVDCIDFLANATKKFCLVCDSTKMMVKDVANDDHNVFGLVSTHITA